MVWKYKNELARKFVHFLALFLIVIFYFVEKSYGKSIALLSLVAILMLFLIFEYLRLEVKRNIPLLTKISSIVRREKESTAMGSDIFLISGIILSLAIFDFRIAIAAALMTTLGDLSAALIGKRYRKYMLTSLPERSWEGIFAEFIVNIIIGIFVFVIFSTTPNAILIILTMALVATFVETIIYKLEDNLVIPIFAGFAGQLVFMLS